MDVAVGIGWAIVQDEFFFVFGAFAQVAVKVHVFPPLKPVGLALGQPCAHGEICFGQIKRC